MRKALKNCLNKGYMPASYEEIFKLKKQGKIEENRWYDSSTLIYNGKIGKATLKQLKNIENIYEEKGRLLYVGYDGDGSLYGDYYLDYDGCFVGVRRRKN